MIAKMVSTATMTLSLTKTWNGSWRPIPNVEKLGVTVMFVGNCVTPATNAMTAVTAMLMMIAPRIFIA